MNFILNK